jgi:hypothetical protein|tara:strand:- start:199 stop:570 length:372 start_codon:yes stop_codon:yes gene_type:complete
MPKLADEIFDKYPFLSLVTYGGQEYVGIVQNQDDTVLSMYDYSKIPDELKPKFLELGDIWWWESNRMIPINLFLKADFAIFTPTLLTFNIKDTEILKGGSVSIADLAKKRSKRRNIQLVRKVK